MQRHLNLTISSLVATMALGSSVIGLAAPEAQSKSKANNIDASLYEAPAPKDTEMADGNAEIERMISAANSFEDYTVDFEMTALKSKKVTEGGTLFFKKPRLIRVETKSGERKGALAVMGESGKVKAHPGGRLSMFTVDLSPRSHFLRTANGYPMVDSDMGSLARALKSFVSKGDMAKVSRPMQVRGLAGQMLVLEIRHKNNEIFKRVAVDPATHLPQAWWDYESGKLVSYSTWSDFKANPGLAKEVFDVKNNKGAKQS